MTELTPLDWQFINGYLDGRNRYKTMPQNAHAAYKHSFRIGRAEITGGELPRAETSRRRVEIIEANCG